MNNFLKKIYFILLDIFYAIVCSVESKYQFSYCTQRCVTS